MILMSWPRLYTECIRQRLAAEDMCVPFHCLILHFRDLILHQREYLIEDLPLSRLVSKKAVRILLDLKQEIIETHIPVASGISARAYAYFAVTHRKSWSGDCI